VKRLACGSVPWAVLLGVSAIGLRAPAASADEIDHARRGRLTVVCVPACVVAIDGARAGRSTLVERSISAGAHRVTLAWASPAATRVLRVEIAADRTRRVYEAGPAPPSAVRLPDLDVDLPY
jgi:hypothetical protein